RPLGPGDGPAGRWRVGSRHRGREVAAGHLGPGPRCTTGGRGVCSLRLRARAVGVLGTRPGSGRRPSGRRRCVGGRRERVLRASRPAPRRRRRGAGRPPAPVASAGRLASAAGEAGQPRV
ncbi:MAG: hypothetical protein AVDCRST_MAG72-2354, partial [uncultured Nocardioidaceae bacterium]